mmetsp:Transcript_2899/g.11178  ORF Transcript_2899/g.11178 Transcript_2899/m.11178 type:complete len:291 (+) Transcript_2899:712-1584(+)
MTSFMFQSHKYTNAETSCNPHTRELNANEMVLVPGLKSSDITSSCVNCTRRTRRPRLGDVNASKPTDPPGALTKGDAGALTRPFEVNFQFDGKGVPNARCAKTCGAAALQGNAFAGGPAGLRRGRTTSPECPISPGCALKCSSVTKCLSNSSTFPPHKLNSTAGNTVIPALCNASTAVATSSSDIVRFPSSTSPLEPDVLGLVVFGGVSNRSADSASTAPTSSSSPVPNSISPSSSSSSSSSKSSTPSAKYASPLDPSRIVSSLSVPFTVTVTTLASRPRRNDCALPNRT